MANQKIAFIGGGHITEIIIGQLTKSRTVSPDLLIASDPNPERRKLLAREFAVKTTASNLEAVDEGEMVFINVRPQVVNDVVKEFSKQPFSPGKLLVSLAAGIPMTKYASLGEDLAIVRALPNPPSQVGQGSIAVVFNALVSLTQQKDILELFYALGEVVILEEKQLDTATALSAPASVLMFFESLTEAGVRLGLERDTSLSIAHQTIAGVMEVWRQRRKPPHVLLKESCTPGGVSVESVAALEQSGFREIVCQAIKQGAAKAEQLGKQ